MAATDSFCRSLAKAELHVHLEGSVGPDTLAELAPELTPAEIRSWYAYADFPAFLESFARIVRRLRGPADYALVARKLAESLARQNVRYAEVILAAGVVIWKKQDFGAIYEAVRDAVKGSPVEIHWILDSIRHFGPEHTMQVAELAAARVEDGVVGFGIGGDEARGPAGWFAEAFEFARCQGLRLTAHAGEGAGPESVWAALEIGAERIGHGIRAIEDPALVRHLADRGIPLEISISSNVMTGVVPDLAAHPVRRLFDAGVPVTLNTDDPAMFSTTLEREYEIARREFGFSEEELRQVAANGFRYAFRGPGAPA